MRLVVRADATAEMGSGHLMRCLALAQSWQDSGGAADFLTHCESDRLAGRLCGEGFGVRRLDSTAGIDALGPVQSVGPAALVLDGYHFDAEYQRRARDYFRPVIAIDDLADLPNYSADVVLNQNIYAPNLRYPHEPYTRLLLGCQWALLRREFLQWAGWRREYPIVARKLLVTLGGSDPHNLTARVLDALTLSEFRDDMEAAIVVASDSPHLPQMLDAARKSDNIRLHDNVTDMPALMAWADAAITAGGSTCWETAFMGLPSLIVVVAANQTGVAGGLQSFGSAVNLGWHEGLTAIEIAAALDSLLQNADQRRWMGDAGRRLVNGQGARNAVAAIRELL